MAISSPTVPIFFILDATLPYLVTMTPQPEKPRVKRVSEMQLINSVAGFADEHLKVKRWLKQDFSDNPTRNVYGWCLRQGCEALKIEPDQLLKLMDSGPSKLFLRIKQHLIALSKSHPRKAAQIKSSMTRFVEFYNDRPTKFMLDVPLKLKGTWKRPYWGLKEFNQVKMEVNYRYRPLFEIGAMAGLGRRELVYLNEHLDEIEPVPDVPEACYLEIPARKSNDRYWKPILPAAEIQQFKAKGKLMTTWGTPIGRFNLTEQFHRACKRANLRTLGTGVHVLRSVFRTVGGNADINEKILEQNMGHFDRYHYDRSHEDLPKRAQALLPLWQYFRQGGAPYVRTEENKALLERMTELERNLENARHLNARLIAQEHVISELDLSFPSLGKRQVSATQIREQLKDCNLSDNEREILQQQLEIAVEEDAFRQRLTEAEKRKQGPLWEWVSKNKATAKK